MNKNMISLLVVGIVVIIGAVLALIGSQNGLTTGDNIPIFALCVALAFIIQWIAFIPAALYKTEKFFDLTGSITFIVVIFLGLGLSGNIDTTSLVLALLVLLWTLRLGIFLFIRIMKSGGDNRLTVIKQSIPRFLITWTIQGLWVSFTLAAALAAITSNSKESFGIIGIVGLAIWIIGYAFEVIADYQKYAFRSKPENRQKFITTGLWSKSRHPNYFGEIILWFGIAIIALPNLQGWQLLTLISPFFVTFLLTKVSGIPLLEKAADEKWSGQKEYEDYKAKTPVLIPKLL